MIDDDYIALCKLAKKFKLCKDDKETIEESDMTLFLKTRKDQTLDSSKESDIIGFSELGGVGVGDLFQNPFSKDSVLSVVEFDVIDDRILFELKEVKGD